ncbi:hypothetical protein Clacol_000111 [Clathrus columnatus]|uniref:F-box domain-containing protein n=1 Tax=Clathrus columnatus TaxID=1419009 RepID=A0AAV4ZW99_9AGAM|nr:hypothetical protein Clacol_000111 [Clathrus columnatus]
MDMPQNHRSSAQKPNTSELRNENTSKRDSDCIESKAQRNASVAINQFPVEILIKIISLAAGCPSEEIPYPCMPFSWVCHGWRSIILGNVTFWTTIVFDDRMTPAFLQEVLHRSQAAPLEIVVPWEFPSVDISWNGLIKDANRVKTLVANACVVQHPLFFSDVMSFFPSLENIFYTPFSETYETFETPDIHPHVRALQITIGSLKGLATPGCFPHLQWLQLVYDTSIPLSPLLEALHCLPNLQVLTLHPSDRIDSSTIELSKPVITFPKLKVLITKYSIPYLINAPKLVHLEVDEYPASGDHLCGFDFSKTTEICFFIGSFHRLYIIGQTGGKDSENGFSLHRNGVESVFDPSCASYPNIFQLSPPFADEEDEDFTDDACSLLTACLRKTTNVKSIILGNRSSDGHGLLNNKEINLFFNALKGPTTVCYLTVFWSLSFAKLCNLLSDGTLFPLLKLIIYCNNFEKSQKLSDITILRKMMDGRFGTSPRKTLHIVLEGFPVVQPELLRQIEDLGIQLLQLN